MANIQKAPDNKFEAVRMLTQARQKLIEATNIFESILEYADPEYMEEHRKRIVEFLWKVNK